MDTISKARIFFNKYHDPQAFKENRIWAIDHQALIQRYLKFLAVIRAGSVLVPVFYCPDSNIKYIPRMVISRVIHNTFIPKASVNYYDLIDTMDFLVRSKEVDESGIIELITFVHKLYKLGSGIHLVLGADCRDEHVDFVREVETIWAFTGINCPMIIGMLESLYGEDKVNDAVEMDGMPFSPVLFSECANPIGRVGKLMTLDELGRLRGEIKN